MFTVSTEFAFRCFFLFYELFYFILAGWIEFDHLIKEEDK